MMWSGGDVEVLCVVFFGIFLKMRASLADRRDERLGQRTHESMWYSEQDPAEQIAVQSEMWTCDVPLHKSDARTKNKN